MVRYGVLLAIFGWFLWTFYLAYQKDPPGSYLLEEMSNSRGRNQAGAAKISVLMALEFVFMLLVLSPHRGHQPKRRILLGLIPALLWSILILAAGFMHSGSLYGVHFSWMLTICLIFYFSLFLAFFDDNYNLPSNGSIKTRLLRLAVLFLTGGLAAAAMVISFAAGYTLLAIFMNLMSF